jgi:hypothetical protein
MADEPEKGNNQEPDEIDKFLATLPSLHIPDEMIDDSDFPRPRKKQSKQVTVTGVFMMIAWFVLILALLTFARAVPPRGNAFHGIFNQARQTNWNMQHVLSAMFYLFGNVAVCAGGLCICLVKKIKMTGSGAVGFWIAGGLSALLAVMMLTML